MCLLVLSNLKLQTDTLKRNSKFSGSFLKPFLHSNSEDVFQKFLVSQHSFSFYSSYPTSEVISLKNKLIDKWSFLFLSVLSASAALLVRSVTMGKKKKSLFSCSFIYVIKHRKKQVTKYFFKKSQFVSKTWHFSRKTPCHELIMLILN